MDNNRMEGAAQDLTGKLEDAAGGLTGDSGLQAEGKLDQGVGQARKTAGKLMDLIKQRPLLSAGVAVVATYLLARRNR